VHRLLCIRNMSDRVTVSEVTWFIVVSDGGRRSTTFFSEGRAVSAALTNDRRSSRRGCSVYDGDRSAVRSWDNAHGCMWVLTQIFLEFQIS
jgi:hypothetical protein